MVTAQPYAQYTTIPYANKYDVGLSVLKNQLEREYNLDIESVSSPVSESTEQKVQIYDKIMKQYPPDDNKVLHPQVVLQALERLDVPVISTG